MTLLVEFFNSRCETWSRCRIRKTLAPKHYAALIYHGLCYYLASGIIVIVVHRLFGFVQRGLAGDSTFYKGAYQKVVSHETNGFSYVLRRN